MVKTLALAIFVAGLEQGSAHAQEANDWTGGWTSRSGRDVEIGRILPGPGSARGWNTFVEALQATRSYRIDILQTPERIAIAFPGGSSNMLTLPETPLGSEPGIRVVNRGEWWTKYVTSARFVAGVLDIAATTFSGWWRDGGPEAAKPKATDYRRHLTLARGSHSGELVLRVHLADEKGEVEYMQTFRREQ